MTHQNASKTLNILLWIAQLLLGIMFLFGGITNTFQPIEKIAATMNWVNEVPHWLVRFIGIAQILGGIGLILPSILRIKPQLTVWAAMGLFLQLICAVIFHISIKETSMIGIPLLFAAITFFIAWGRWKKVPVKSRNAIVSEKIQLWSL